MVAITGSASGIGLATAKLLASRGAILTLADSRKEPLETTVNQIREEFPNTKVHARQVNVINAHEVASWLDECISRFKKIDGAANLAGTIGSSILLKNIAELSDEDFDSVINVNVKGVFNCLRAELQRMQRGASIVNAASVAGLIGAKNCAPYCTSKHAVIGLTRTAANEFGNSNIRVNAIAPGGIETPMLEQIQTNDQKLDGGSTKGDSTARISLGRAGKPLEIAKLIAFLLSEDSSYTTGAVYTADGGFSSA